MEASIIVGPTTLSLSIVWFVVLRFKNQGYVICITYPAEQSKTHIEMYEYSAKKFAQTTQLCMFKNCYIKIPRFEDKYWQKKYQYSS